MISTWIADISPLYEVERYCAYYEVVPEFRKEKADKLRFQKDKAQSVGVWILLDKIRKEYGISEKAAFNLSHSGDYVLCSVDMECGRYTQLGCDIEAVDKMNLKIAERFFCTSEYEAILQEDSILLQTDKFYRFWVLKESFMKATREGMALELKSFEIQLSSPPVLLKKPDRFSEEYYYREYVVAGIPYKIAVCSTEDKMDSRIRMEFKL